MVEQPTNIQVEPDQTPCFAASELGPYTVFGHRELMDHRTKATEAMFELLRSEFQL